MDCPNTYPAQVKFDWTKDAYNRIPDQHLFTSPHDVDKLFAMICDLNTRMCELEAITSNSNITTQLQAMTKNLSSTSRDLGNLVNIVHAAGVVNKRNNK